MRCLCICTQLYVNSPTKEETDDSVLGMTSTVISQLVVVKYNDLCSSVGHNLYDYLLNEVWVGYFICLLLGMLICKTEVT